jgi:hypothetical protein
MSTFSPRRGPGGGVGDLLPGAWETAFDSGGRQYYFNRATNETRWVPPFSAGVQHRTPVPTRRDEARAAGTPRTRPLPPPSFGTPSNVAGRTTGRRTAHTTSTDVADALGLGGEHRFARQVGPAALRPTEAWQKKSTSVWRAMPKDPVHSVHAHHHSTMGGIIMQQPDPAASPLIAGRVGTSAAHPAELASPLSELKIGGDRLEAARAARDAFVAEVVERCSMRGYSAREIAAAISAPPRAPRSAERTTDMMLRLRAAVRALPGGSTFSSLGRLVRAKFGGSTDGWISLEEFGGGLAALSLPFTIPEYAALFSVFDRAPTNGFIALDDLVAAIRGPLSARRLGVIERAWASLGAGAHGAAALGAVLAAVDFSRTERVVAQLVSARDAKGLFAGECLLCTVTFYANLAHSLTCSP